MATQYTSLLGLALPVTGELSGSWGDIVNDSITSLLDAAISGTTSLTTDADVTLTTTDGVANEARQSIILWNPASGTTTRNITAPAQSKIYTVINASGGTQSIVFRGAGPTTGVTIIKGESAVVAWNGSDFIKISNTGGGGSFTNVTISGTTTLSGLTASTALALNASKEVVSVTNTGTGNNVLATSPTLVTPALGTPSSATLTNATGLPISTGVSGLGTGIATALAVNVGTAGAPVINGGALGTPSSGTVTNLTGTASININGTVGATTASTGAFTTLSASGAVTLSGATANGVVYADGSKVLTTGSALTFDGSILSVSKSDTTNPSLFTVSNTSTTGSFAAAQMALKSYNGSSVVEGLVLSSISNSWSYGNTLANSAQVYTGLSNGLALVAESASGPIRFLLGSTAAEQMRLTSTGLGIGTSSPAYKLQVVGGAVAASRARSNTAGDMALMVAPSDSTQQYGFRIDSNTNNLNLDAYTGSGYATRLILDSSGNLGLGVTPSAWSTLKGLQVLNANMAGLGNKAYFSANAFFNGSNWVYQASDFANLYIQQDGQHQWNTSASGTAGDAISFSQVMTLDASGNLGIGTSSPASQLDVSKTGDAIVSLTSSGVQRYQLIARSNGNFEVYDQSSTASRLTLTQSGNLGLGVTPSAWGTLYSTKAFQISASSVVMGDVNSTILGTNYYFDSAFATKYIKNNYALQYTQDGSTGIHKWLTAPSGTAGNAITFTQAMTLDASGNLLIGRTSGTGANLDVYESSSSDATIRIGNVQNGNFTAIGKQGASAYGATAAADAFLYSDGTLSIMADNAGSVIKFSAGGNTERARIDSSGNLGIGTSSPTSKLSLGGNMDFQQSSNLTTTTGYLNIAPSSTLILDTGDTVQFRTSGTERARIDSSGNLLVAATAVGNGGKLYVNGSISIGTSTTGAQSSMAKDTTQLTASVSTSATTIYTDISSGMSSASAGYFIIHGSNNAGAGFMDVVVAKANGTPVVVSSSTLEGSPAARTYTVSSSALQLAMASGTFNINLKATVLGYPF